MSPRILVVHRRSAYTDFVADRNTRIQKLIEANDSLVSGLVSAHDNHLTSMERVERDLKERGLAVTWRHDIGNLNPDEFDLVVTAMDVQMPKPHPEQLLAVLTHFMIAPQQMVYIGDSLLDAQASYAAGVPFIAFQNNDLPADLHIQALSQIPPILGLA